VVAEESILQTFDEFLRDVFRQKIVLGKRNEALRRTGDLLLPRLISDEVDVSELDIAVPEEGKA
jgi:type I restriction enzyme, S subunit